MSKTLFYFKAGFLFALAALILGACNRGATAPAPTSSPTESGAATASSAPALPPTAPAPSATPEALAARVDDYTISLAEYQAELALFQQAAGHVPTAEDQKTVLDDLIGQALLAHAAQTQGFRADEALLQQRIQALEDQLGGAQALDAWMSAYSFTDQTFKEALARHVEAAWMRDQIVAELPANAEQVHVQQILTYSLEEANAALARLQGGESFDSLAAEFDPLNKGDLGWFPRGFLPDQRLEQAAFGLEAGQVSPVVETLAGFHIIKLLERESQRVLEPQALLALQTHAVQEWVLQHLGQSEVEILLP